MKKNKLLLLACGFFSRRGPRPSLLDTGIPKALCFLETSPRAPHSFAWRSFDVMELRSTPGDKNEDLERAKSRALAFRARLVNLRPISVMICMNEDRRHLCILLS